MAARYPLHQKHRATLPRRVYSSFYIGWVGWTHKDPEGDLHPWYLIRQGPEDEDQFIITDHRMSARVITEAGMLGYCVHRMSVTRADGGIYKCVDVNAFETDGDRCAEYDVVVITPPKASDKKLEPITHEALAALVAELGA